MEKNQSILITLCPNGFVINSFHTGSQLSMASEQMVAQSMQELVLLIRNHFDYRNHDIQPDPDMVKGG